MNSFLWFLLGALATALPLGGLLWHRHRQLRTRTAQLTNYLDAVNTGRESTLPHAEDALSLLEDAIYKTVSELRLAKEQAQKERLRQADNLADIAHQLKTPLTSMSLMTQLLDAEATNTQRDCLHRIDSQLSRLDRLTASLLTMSRLDAGAIQFTLTTVPFAELVDRAAEPIAADLHSRQQTLTIQGEQQAVTCDLIWTAEALLNLLKNCSEHTPAQGSITASCIQTPLYVQITIEDNGSGFPPADLPKLFRRFYRGTNATPNSIGIGLALAYSILREQDGILRAENRAEGGARFIIHFYRAGSPGLVE